MKTFSYTALFSYGLFGLPLALVALPIYMYVPQFYAERFGLSLTLIGSALLLARIFDAFVDPAIGLWVDRQRGGYGHLLAWSLPLLIAGFVALFHPPQSIGAHPFIWFLSSLTLVYLGFSLATITYQSWGAALTQAQGQRTRLTAVREGCGLVGVIIASALPGIADLYWLSLVFIVTLLAAALLLLRHAPRPAITSPDSSSPASLLAPFRHSRFRWLFAIFMLNGIAAAIPATLFLFFVNDRLRLPHYAGIFLLLYFIAAALSMPLWVTLSKRLGEQRAWLIGMVLAIVSFVWSYTLTQGAFNGYAFICILSGISLGADLALPPALLAAVIGHAGDIGKCEGTYFGVWSWSAKMNLALAAGISLPLLEWLGYHIGTKEAHSLQALALGYALLPCALKSTAALLLWRAPLHRI
jgi:Na+/melibiose symporter-like transporter